MIANLPPSRKNTLILGFTLLVVMLGYGMVLPVMPFYIEELGAGGRELGWLMASYSLMQLIFAPIWGTLSDRIGRKPVLSLGVLGYAIALLMFGLATEYWMLFLARTLSGILSSATMPTAMAYIGDNLPEKERSSGMGQLGAAMGVGIVLGPLLGGMLSSEWLALPFFIGSGLAALAFLLVLFLLPESRAPNPRQTKRFLSWEIIRRTLLSPAGVILLLIFIMSFGLSNFQGIIGLYVVDKLAFNTKQVGTIWMVLGGVMILAQGVLTGPLTKRIGELMLIRIGLLVGTLGFILITLASGYITMLLSISILTLALALIGPALNAFVSYYAGDHQGAVMGLNSATASLGRIVGPLWGGYIFDINLAYPFINGAATLLLGFLVSIIGIRSPMIASSSTSQNPMK
jgi:DHA1 family multidrug resistance protein-like MFS transporter